MAGEGCDVCVWLIYPRCVQTGVLILTNGMGGGNVKGVWVGWVGWKVGEDGFSWRGMEERERERMVGLAWVGWPMVWSLCSRFFFLPSFFFFSLCISFLSRAQKHNKHHTTVLEQSKANNTHHPGQQQKKDGHTHNGREGDRTKPLTPLPAHKIFFVVIFSTADSHGMGHGAWVMRNLSQFAFEHNEKKERL
ncbi:MAG: hypothetical protein BYD32DRAFT_197153 [Podila humilis]|nr:MAG: hypothetical protein BYD32DRAFT_197153 [Podila humilis]